MGSVPTEIAKSQEMPWRSVTVPPEEESDKAPCETRKVAEERADVRKKTELDAVVDTASEDSFPASDAPSRTPITGH